MFYEIPKKLALNGFSTTPKLVTKRQYFSKRGLLGNHQDRQLRRIRRVPPESRPEEEQRELHLSRRTQDEVDITISSPEFHQWFPQSASSHMPQLHSRLFPVVSPVSSLQAFCVAAVKLLFNDKGKEERAGIRLASQDSVERLQLAVWRHHEKVQTTHGRGGEMRQLGQLTTAKDSADGSRGGWTVHQPRSWRAQRIRWAAT